MKTTGKRLYSFFKYGFDYIQHEQLRKDLVKGRIGLARNRLPAQTQIEDVKRSDVQFLEKVRKYFTAVKKRGRASASGEQANRR